MELEPDSPRRQGRQADPRGFATSADADDNSDEHKVVYLCDHLGYDYVCPFELCRSYQDTESLWKQIYANRGQEWLDKIAKGEYVTLSGGNIILPSVWSTIVRPSMTIIINFNRAQYDSEPRPRPLRLSRSPSPSRRQRDDPAGDDVRVVTFDVDSPRPPIHRRDSDLSSSADSSDSVTSTSDQSLSSRRTDIDEPPRDVVVPVDAEGNQLSFEVDTKHSQNLIEYIQGSGDRNADAETHLARKDTSNFRIETFRITRAMIDEVQGRSQLQIYVLPGPENPHLQPAVALTWCHISASQLDFTHFRDVCLTMPHMSDRLRKLTSEMLTKVYADKVKPFDGGMFIEPGAVLRADESDQPDPKSVIFCCVPYFALQPPSRKSLPAENTSFPQRTLMQAFYPYEPVRERDQEQSYRRFSEDRSGSIIHVPNLWVMIIGSTHVVTCGHEPLTKEMTNSMTIVEEDIKQLGMKPVPENDVTTIKFTDVQGRDFVFPLSTCRSYFQMEAKAREIGYMVDYRAYNAKIHLQYKTQEGSFKITPREWKEVVTRTDLISIQLASVSDDETAQTDQLSPVAADDYTTGILTSVPPFFHWPQQSASKADEDQKGVTAPEKSSAQQPSDYLEQVEKALKTQVLEGTMINAVDEAFTSTDHYQSLPKATYADARADFADLKTQYERVKKAISGPEFHQITIDKQRTGILEKSIEFLNVTRMICDLFVTKNDESEITGKVWGVMARIHEYVLQLDSYRPSDKPSDAKDTASKQNDSWLIRPTAKPCLLSLPDSSPEFIKSIGQCKSCRKFRSFSSQEDALRHLQRHTNAQSERQKLQEPAQTDDSAKDKPSAPEMPLDPRNKAWVMASTEFWHEQTNAGALEILTKACILAGCIFNQAWELTQGVQNEDGQMSEFYTLPKELPGTFRAIVVFFMATERALYEAVGARGQYYRLKNSYTVDVLPYSKKGLQVLENFKGDAMRSLMVARSQLCYMVRSDPPLDVTRHLSRGPEYICGWLMRRLLLKPLQKRATVGDLYREYISRLQFQVNHHPSKRLLRDLNLLQEELQILISVTSQQANLVRNYLRVLDDATYSKLIPSRRSMFPYESMLLGACLDNLNLFVEDYGDLIRRCGPLANRTKQSLEINEEDHGKAIMVFTVVTVIFLPLSFATSYLGMNTDDIRNMDQKQSLFWIVAIPLTVVTVGACLIVGYYGENIRDMIVSLCRRALGKQEINYQGGISVLRRKRPLNAPGNSSSTTLESSAFANETEFIRPRPVVEYETVAQSSTDWINADDALYMPIHKPATLRLRQYSPTLEARSQSHVERVPMAASPPHRMQRSRLRSGRDNFDVHYDNDYVEERPRRGAQHYSDWSVLDHELQAGAPQRRVYASSRPWRSEVHIRQEPEIHIRQAPQRADEFDRADDNEVPQYTWGKKRSGRSHRQRYSRDEWVFER